MTTTTTEYPQSVGEFFTRPGFEVTPASHGWPGNRVLDDQHNPRLLGLDPTTPAVVAIEWTTVQPWTDKFNRAWNAEWVVYVAYRGVMWQVTGIGPSRYGSIGPGPIGTNYFDLGKSEVAALMDLRRTAIDEVITARPYLERIGR